MKESSRYFRYFTYIKPLTRLPIVKTYSPVIFTLLTMVVFIIFAIKPTVEIILVLQKKLADAERILTQINEKVNNLSKGRENYQNLNQGIKNKIQSAVPDIIQLRSLIDSLEGSAKSYEASISALQIQPLTLGNTKDTTKAELEKLAFTFNVEGPYEVLTAILQDLKTSSRLISIDKLIFNKVGEEKNLIMSISGEAYFLK